MPEIYFRLRETEMRCMNSTVKRLCLARDLFLHKILFKCHFIDLMKLEFIEEEFANCFEK